MRAARAILGAVLLFVAGPLSPLFARTSGSHCWCGPGGCYAAPTLPGTVAVSQSWARGGDNSQPDVHLRLRGGGRRQTRSAKEADEHERDVTRIGGALVSPVPADLARDSRGRGLQDLARSDSPCLIDDPLGIPRALRNDPDPSYLDGGIGGFSQYGDTEVGDKARAWETDFEQEGRQNAASDCDAEGRDGASGGTDKAKTIGDILDELGIGKLQKAKAEDGHAPEIAREMGLSDPSEDNPDANQVMDLVRFAQQHNRLSSWGGWTVHDTNRLYWGVRYFGSDFDTMQQALFRNRTRAEIKRKFSVELRRRPWLIDHALENPLEVAGEGVGGADWQESCMAPVGAGVWDFSGGMPRMLGRADDPDNPFNTPPPVPREYVAENIRRTKMHLSTIRFKERKHIRDYARSAGKENYVGAAQRRQRATSKDAREGLQRSAEGFGGQDGNPYPGMGTDAEKLQQEGPGGNNAVPSRVPGLPNDVKAGLVGVQGLDADVAGLGNKHSQGLQGLGGVEDLSALIDMSKHVTEAAGLDGAGDDRECGDGLRDWRAEADAQTGSGGLESFDDDEFTEEEEEEEEDSGISMSSDLLRLHLEKPWRAGGGTKDLTSESGAEQALHRNITDVSQLSTVRLPGGRDGENSCVGSDDALAPGGSDGGGSSGSRKEEGSRGMAVGKALCEEPDWSRRAREVSGVSLRALQSTGRAKGLRQTDADTGVLKRTGSSNIEQEEEGKDVTEDARIKSAERQDRNKETSPSSFAPAPAAVKAVVSQEAGQAAFKSMHAAPDATAPGPVGEAFRAVSSGASDAANHLTREEQAIQAASRVRASLNKRESPQQLLERLKRKRSADAEAMAASMLGI